MNDKQEILEEYFKVMNYSAWLYKMGLQETHGILYSRIWNMV